VGTSIGMLKSLGKFFKEQNIKIDRVVGISGGSIIASLFALGYDYAQIEKIILHFWRKDIFSDINPFLFPGFLKGDKWEESLRDGFESKQFTETKIPLTVMAAKLGFISLEAEKFETGFIHEAVRASSSMPFVLAPKRIGTSFYIDGATVTNNIEDIKNLFPCKEMYFLSIEYQRPTFWDYLCGTFNYFLKMRIFKHGQALENDPIIHKIVVPIFRDFRVWSTENLPFLILEGEKTADNYLKEIKSYAGIHN
jgi:hypothetical protein